MVGIFWRMSCEKGTTSFNRLKILGWILSSSLGRSLVWMLWRVSPSIYPTVYYTQMVWNCRGIIQMRQAAGTWSRTCVSIFFKDDICKLHCKHTNIFRLVQFRNTCKRRTCFSRQIMIIAGINNTWKILKANVKPDVTSIYWGRRKSCYWNFSRLAPMSKPMYVVLIFFRYRHFGFVLLHQRKL